MFSIIGKKEKKRATVQRDRSLLTLSSILPAMISDKRLLVQSVWTRVVSAFDASSKQVASQQSLSSSVNPSRLQL